MEQKEGDNPMGEDEAAGGGGSEKGRITLIKIKMPTKKAAEEEEEEAARSHYCKECNKSFNSGKALGGHMSSAHVQANKLTSNSKRKSPAGSSSSSSSAAACSVCGRAFRSLKSLFGHMRCHPDRLWRGMEPPPEMRINSSDEDDDNELGFFNLKGWPTSKRGRPPVSSGPDTSSFVAGYNLMKMLKEDDGKKPADEENQESDELYMTAIEVLVSGKREKVMNSNSESEKYKCNECGRVFATHQALGGHRSSHNKFKMTIINTNALPSQPTAGAGAKKINQDVVDANAAAAAAAAFAFDLNVPPSDDEEEEEMVDSSNS